jgi:osmotically-inducible protein OsmY
MGIHSEKLKKISERFIAGAAIISAVMMTGGVTGQKNDMIEDRQIATAVETDLLIDESVAAHLVDVMVVDGIVTLSGSVDNLLAKQRAVRHAQSIRGVRGVVDKIAVKPVERTDREIARDINQALLMDRAAESYEIDVAVEDGVVRLSGTVQSLAEKLHAERIAKRVKGISAVDNSIDIEAAAKRTDEEIAADIRKQLSFDPYVAHRMITVDVNDGVVTLSGTVGSLSEKAFAYNDALVLGVTEIDDAGLDIELWAKDRMQKPAKITIASDAAIAEAVEDALLFDPRTKLFEIDVSVENGRVVLGGTVGSLAAKLAAEDDAKNTRGVQQVVNNIDVRASRPFRDEELVRDVNYVMLWDPIIERHEIAVEARNGAVYLYGDVDNYFEKRRAETLASRVAGVIAVRNYLRFETEPWEWRSDEFVASRIREEYRLNTLVDHSDLSVSVDDGVALITGAVGSQNELDTAIENAFDGGARMVRTRVKYNGMNEYGYYHYRQSNRWWE